jgi:hypothetical protein
MVNVAHKPIYPQDTGNWSGRAATFLLKYRATAEFAPILLNYLKKINPTLVILLNI